MADDPYSRVYWRLQEEYPDVYRDDKTLAAWVRLLIGADAMHPSPAPLPRWIRAGVLKTLADTGLVIFVKPHHYRIKGLQAERERRSEQARRNASARYQQSSSRAPAVRPQSNGTPSQAEQSQDKTSRALGSIDPPKETAEEYQARLAVLMEQRILGKS